MSVFQKTQDKIRKDALGKLRNISSNPQKIQKVHMRIWYMWYRYIRTKQILTMSCRLLVVCKEYPNRRDLKSLPKGSVRKMFTSWDSGCSFIRQRVLHRNVACQWNARALKHSSSPGGVGWSWVSQVSQYFQQQLHLASKGRFDTSACISLKSWGMVWFGMETDGEEEDDQLMR